MADGYRICTRCIMDTTVPGIRFDEAGMCNLCQKFIERMSLELRYDAGGQASLQSLVEKIKQRGEGHNYNCLIGISGGIDSSYVAYLVKKKFGLRPLAVHIDNGWDSEIAVANMEQVIKRLDIDLYTYVLDWEEFKDLQVSFLKSSISHIDIPSDHAIWAILTRIAVDRGIRYFISGYSIATEALMPKSWLYDFKDARLINGIQRQFGHCKLKNYPQLRPLDLVYYLLVKGFKNIRILSYVPYVKQEAKRVLIEELGWRDYGSKHYENIFTRFFSAYYLPRKFGYDLRRPFISALILSGQMTRDEALREIQSPPAPADQLEEDIEFVIKKLNLSREEFEQIMRASPKLFSDYPNSYACWQRFNWLAQAVRKRSSRVG